MQLLTENQPWNLIIFMAIPVILAETLAITELAILFNRKARRWIKNLNLYAGLLAGIYFLGIFFYLMKSAVIPLTITGGWRGPADIIAVGFYLAGVIPLFGISLLEIRLLYPLKSSEDRLRVHVILVGTFLILAHVAMIFGMLNPELLGWVNPEPHMTTM
jgi:hypothetical protein